MANNGSIKYCVNWNNTETVTSPQRVLIARALQNSMQEWVGVLVGFDGFPLTTVDVNVVSYAAKSVDQIQGDTTGLDINTVTPNSKGEPECDPRCYRSKYLGSETGMSECPGGDKSSYDMVLRLETMPTYPDINILGIATKDWQRMHPGYFLSHANDEEMFVLRHEIGHSFGLLDFPDGPIGNQGGFLMIRPEYIIHVAEFDAWMLRDWWRKTKAHQTLAIRYTTRVTDESFSCPKTLQLDETIPLPGSRRTIFDFESINHSITPFEDASPPVIIIGSSMVGMFMGILLGYHGIHSISFDRHPSTAIHPRAALFLLRTVEVLRQLGLEDLFISESEKNFDLDAGMLVVEKLYQGKTIAAYQESDPKEVAQITPSKRLWLTQDMFEPLLRNNAATFGAQQKFGQVVEWYQEVDDGVIVIVRDTHTREVKKYKTRYLIAADGNRSATRRKENIQWHGPGDLANSISINFKADLVPYLGTRAVHGVTYIMNADFTGGFRLEAGGKGGFLIVSKAKGREAGFEPDSVSEKEAREMFEACSGIEAEECGFEVDFISYWTVAAYNADEYSSKGGKVFIMGDAAHVMPPSGGMSGNTGVADAYNLAWKMAYVLSNKASPNLLKTYNQERQPAGDFSMHQAFSRLVNRVFHGKGLECEKELPDLVCELGYRYTSGTIVPSDENDMERSHEDPHDPYVLPGGRLPHVWLIDVDGEKLSSLDLVKRNFVLFTTDVGSPWLQASEKQSIAIDAYPINSLSQPYLDVEDSTKKVWKMEDGEALLVRPDGIIAWKAPRMTSGHDEQLAEALRIVLHG
ncbi:hypothetical protein D6D05_03504 [Aureobasidium pullulans]|nr:hypothetical protein D6D05_03504 [Aureobasidium pullulans]